MNPMTDTRAPIPVPDPLNELLLAPSPKGTKEMLIYEDLARERRREAERQARHQRLVRSLNAIRRWQRVSDWAARRAKRAAELM
ncbi:MAG TPA: hypothetical protein VGX25_04715 [Actinophytocola sp.]|uniref:hypothetical protein n=1 Tax=Actinophytocola sp. TaxID=1872138 RepID=UPI002DDCE17D|nr:hypothetical protein [Actinophytocola sp.]HEV2778684.1 hypothetical protein [Actinophytocola sp.]